MECIVSPPEETEERDKALHNPSPTTGTNPGIAPLSSSSCVENKRSDLGYGTLIDGLIERDAVVVVCDEWRYCLYVASPTKHVKAVRDILDAFCKNYCQRRDVAKGYDNESPKYGPRYEQFMMPSVSHLNTHLHQLWTRHIVHQFILYPYLRKALSEEEVAIYVVRIQSDYSLTIDKRPRKRRKAANVD